MLACAMEAAGEDSAAFPMVADALDLALDGLIQ